MFRIPPAPSRSAFKVRPPKAAPPVEPLAVNTLQASKMLGVTARTLYNWTRDGKIPHSRVGRRVLYSVAALKAIISGSDLDSPPDLVENSTGKFGG